MKKKILSKFFLSDKFLESKQTLPLLRERGAVIASCDTAITG